MAQPVPERDRPAADIETELDDRLNPRPQPLEPSEPDASAPIESVTALGPSATTSFDSGEAPSWMTHTDDEIPAAAPVVIGVTIAVTAWVAGVYFGWQWLQGQ